MNFFFVTDLHGKVGRYSRLFDEIKSSLPDCVLFGGDNLPLKDPDGFLLNYLIPHFRELKKETSERFPEIVMIPGNDDPACFDRFFYDIENEGLIKFIPEKTISVKGLAITGYPFVPPTPFMLKDREKYDVSRYVDPGCLHPFEGRRTVEPDYDLEFSSIAKDLKKLSGGVDPKKSVFLFHAPPYKSKLDRAALDGQSYDHVPLDVFAGSIAIQRFIDEFQPLLTLHGHIHESYRLTGEWNVKTGATTSLSAASDAQGLTIVCFDPNNHTVSKREEFD